MRDLSDAARRPPVAALAYANADAARFRDEAAVGSEAGVAAEHMRLVVRGVEHERTVLVDARISVIADGAAGEVDEFLQRSEEHTSELQSLMRISYAVFCLKKKKTITIHHTKLTTICHTMSNIHTNHINI